MLLSATSNRVALIDIKPMERTSVAPPTAQSPHLAFLTFRLVDDDPTLGGRNGAAYGTSRTNSVGQEMSAVGGEPDYRRARQKVSV
jgi:hypothetical protein